MQALYRNRMPKYSESQKQRLVEKVVSFIRGRVRPKRLLLFGSVLSDRFDSVSDIDIVVIISDTENPVEVRRVLYGAKALPETSVDFLVIRESDYERESQDGGIYYVARTEGMEIVD